MPLNRTDNCTNTQYLIKCSSISHQQSALTEIKLTKPEYSFINAWNTSSRYWISHQFQRANTDNFTWNIFLQVIIIEAKGTSSRDTGVYIYIYISPSYVSRCTTYDKGCLESNSHAYRRQINRFCHAALLYQYFSSHLLTWDYSLSTGSLQNRESGSNTTVPVNRV